MDNVNSTVNRYVKMADISWTKEAIADETKKLSEEVTKLKEALEKVELLKAHKAVSVEHDSLKAELEAKLKEL